MPIGRIKWFSPAKGYGFITKEDGSDIFLHYTGLLDPKDRRLFSGDQVEFEEVEGDKGRKAIMVRRTTSDAPRLTKGE
ncbi:MAG: cold shock domain-containing protein [Planctomycetota bacterium]|nr:cold shock domain-containing protein [Planctomycetota bacterium]